MVPELSPHRAFREFEYSRPVAIRETPRSRETPPGGQIVEPFYLERGSRDQPLGGTGESCGRAMAMGQVSN
jgi:hypothetical protein